MRFADFGDAQGFGAKLEQIKDGVKIDGLSQACAIAPALSLPAGFTFVIWP
jgi:hypothetical protein